MLPKGDNLKQNGPSSIIINVTNIFGGIYGQTFSKYQKNSRKTTNYKFGPEMLKNSEINNLKNSKLEQNNLRKSQLNNKPSAPKGPQVSREAN